MDADYTGAYSRGMMDASDIADLMTRLGMTQTELAERVGVKQSTVSRWLKKGAQPDPPQLEQLERMMREGAGATPPERSGAQRQEQRLNGFRMAPELPQVFKGELPMDVPVYGLAIGGSDGDFKFNGNIVDRLRRPPGLAHKRDVYGIYVSGESMYPAHKQGDPLYVDPHRQPRTNEDAIIELWPADPDSSESGEGFLKRYVKSTPSEWIFEQFNPPGQIAFKRSEVKAVHRVIPLAELLGF